MIPIFSFCIFNINV
uniref:Uncharacterized protein n=1 Tax=Lepeophtheirus salmonis TaxID=72036 RepID=A0A0K2UYR3_LEPSM